MNPNHNRASRISDVRNHFPGNFLFLLLLLAIGLVPQTAECATFTFGMIARIEGPAAGSDSIVLGVTPPTNTWTATVNSSWLHLSAANQSGKGSTNVVFTFDPNSGITRTGTMTIAGQTVTITQAGSTYTLVPPRATALATGLQSPFGVAVDKAGNIYTIDNGFSEIVKWSAASPNAGSPVAVTATTSPTGLTMDAAGNIYFTDYNSVKKWSATDQTVTNLVSSGLGVVTAVAVDAAGNLYISDEALGAVMKWTATNNSLTTLIPNLDDPFGVALDSAGDVYVCDSSKSVIKEWNAGNGQVQTLLSFSGISPVGIAVDSQTNIYFTDFINSLRKWTATNGNITVLTSSLEQPVGLAFDTSGNNLYIADSINAQVKVYSIVSNTLNVAVAPEVSYPTAVAIDPGGNPLVLDSYFGTVGTWSATSNILTTLFASEWAYSSSALAVDSSTNVYLAFNNGEGLNTPIPKWNAASGDVTFLTATNFLLFSPAAIAVDAASNLYIADGWFYTIDVASQSGTNLDLIRPVYFSSGVGGVALDAAGNLYYTDNDTGNLDAMTPGGNTFTVQAAEEFLPTTLAVDGAGDVYSAAQNNVIGEWVAASHTFTNLVSTNLQYVNGVAVDGNGNVYFADTGLHTFGEVVYAYVDATPKSEFWTAGEDILPSVLPATADLQGPFAPTSDQPWLTITSVTNGVVSFAFTANTTSSNRTAHINLLGNSIAVTQSNPTILTLTPLGAGAVQLSWTEGINYPSTCVIWSTTNLSLPITNWTVAALGSYLRPGYMQWIDYPTNAQTFYTVTWP